MLKKNIAVVGPNRSVNMKIGRLLAEKLEMKFLDTDGYLEYCVGMPNEMIVSDYGAKFYLKLESQHLSDLESFDNTLIGTSTTTVMTEQNVSILKEFSYIILLVANDDIVLERLKKDMEIVLKDEFINRREEIFSTISSRIGEQADIIVDTTTLPPKTIVAKIVEELGKIIR